MILDLIQVLKIITLANNFLIIDNFLNVCSKLYSLTYRSICIYTLSRVKALTRLSSLATKSITLNRITRAIYEQIAIKISFKLVFGSTYSFKVGFKEVIGIGDYTS